MVISQKKEESDMLGTWIVVLAVVFLLCVAIWMLSSTGLFKKIRSTKKAVGKKMDEMRKEGDVEITDPPVISYKEPGKRNYRDVVMTRKVFRIGTSAKCDLVLDDPKVERIHAEIVKKIKGGRVAYFFVNHGKVNPSNMYDCDARDYDPLLPRESVELDEEDLFYIGDTKVIVKLNENKHVPTNTERILYEEKKGTREKREPSKKTKSTKTESTGKKKRVDTVRIVSRNELDI